MKQHRTIGKLRHRVTFQSATHTNDPGGQPIPTWSDEMTVWASIEPITGPELIQAQQVQAQVTHRIVVRFHEDIRNNGPRWRISHEDRIFEIQIARDVAESRDMIELLCVEQV